MALGSCTWKRSPVDVAWMCLACLLYLLLVGGKAARPVSTPDANSSHHISYFATPFPLTFSIYKSRAHRPFPARFGICINLSLMRDAKSHLSEAHASLFTLPTALTHHRRPLVL